MKAFAIVIFLMGASICTLNFYLSFLRRPPLERRKAAQQAVRNVSGFPLVGSLMVAISLLMLKDTQWLLAAGLPLIAIDTGGVHWFLGMMLAERLRSTERRE